MTIFSYFRVCIYIYIYTGKYRKICVFITAYMCILAGLKRILDLFQTYCGQLLIFELSIFHGSSKLL